MYKHVSKFTKELREFTYDDVDLNALMNGGRKNLDPEAEPEPVAEEDKHDLFYCRICDKDVMQNQVSLSHHIKGKNHKKKLAVYEARYKKFVRVARLKVLKATKPRNKAFRRLIFYNMLVQFE